MGFRTSLARVAGPMRRAAAVADGDAGTKLNFSLLLPHKPVYDNALVDQVTIPGATGVLGVLKGHMKTMASLQAGVLSVQNDGVTETFFVSGGFAFVEGDRAMVAAVEAVSIDDWMQQQLRRDLPRRPRHWPPQTMKAKLRHKPQSTPTALCSTHSAFKR